jgi:DNA-binding MarR family transcriptional regulator
MEKLQSISAFEPRDLLIGAMLRVPAQAIHHRIIHDLNAAGFDDLSLPHIAVFQYPGPDGVRPGILAERAGISKQAMNQLLKSLEGMGYLVRHDETEGSRARIVRFTERGHAVFAGILKVLSEVELEWSAELGAKEFAHLKMLLFRVWQSNQLKVPGRSQRQNEPED